MFTWMSELSLARQYNRNFSAGHIHPDADMRGKWGTMLFLAYSTETGQSLE